MQILKEKIVRYETDGSIVKGYDAGELIRCKDCKHAQKIFLKNLPWVTQWEYSCRYFNTHSVMGDDFCSRAERRENETD